jgi:hypothetical protein
VKNTLIGSLPVVLALPASAQVAYVSGTYHEDFASIQNAAIFSASSALPTGWASSQSYYTDGAQGVTNNTRAYSFSATPGAEDKGFGFWFSANTIGPEGYFGVALRNDSGHAFSGFSVDYEAAQWAKGAVTNQNQTVYFQYGLNAAELLTPGFTGVPNLNLSSINDGDGAYSAIDGSSAENRIVIGGDVSITWQPGQVLWLRWRFPNYNGTTADHAMAIHDFSFAAIPEPSAFAAALGLLGLCVATCRRPRRR